MTEEAEVVAKARRRRFTGAEKLRVLREADRCSRPGELGALLRREGLYSSHLSAWRAARKRGELAGLTSRPRGAKPQRPDPREMTSKPVALLLADLGVTKTHSRPHVSNDNPYSESQFKTLKYRPDFPERFGGIEDARGFCGDFFPWYNTEHHHVGLGLFTPHDVHHGLAEEKRARRAAVLAQAYEEHPERFPRGLPMAKAVPTAVWINPPAKTDALAGAETTLAQVSGGAEIVALVASYEADFGTACPTSPILTLEGNSIAAVQ